MSTNLRTSLYRNLGTRKKNFGLQLKKYESLTTAYVSNRKMLKFAMESLSPNQFEEIIKRKLVQIGDDTCTRTELMKEDIQHKLIRLDNTQSLHLWMLAKEKGIVEAIRQLYLNKL